MITEQFQHEFAAEMHETPDEDLLAIYGFFWLLIEAKTPDETIKAMFVKDLPEIKNGQDVQSLMANVFGPEFQDRGISDEQITAAVDAMRQNEGKPPMSAKGKWTVALTTVIGAVLFGLVAGPLVGKHFFPKHKGIVIFLLTVAGGALGFWTGHMLVSSQTTEIAKAMLSKKDEQLEEETV